VTREEVQNRTGFELLIKNPLDTTRPPNPTELTVLRNEVDPHRYIIGRG
jgi:glutaconate CoA-transferase subunit B